MVGQKMVGQLQVPVPVSDHVCPILKPYSTVKYEIIIIPSCSIYFEPLKTTFPPRCANQE